ncbi:hypothetical protein KM043_003494 [Ampulex compressa]|nr:hypothetical protein KM043_003494 [Ampulex compressa]
MPRKWLVVLVLNQPRHPLPRHPPSQYPHPQHPTSLTSRNETASRWKNSSDAFLQIAGAMSAESKAERRLSSCEKVDNVPPSGRALLASQGLKDDGCEGGWEESWRVPRRRMTGQTEGDIYFRKMDTAFRVFLSPRTIVLRRVANGA